MAPERFAKRALQGHPLDNLLNRVCHCLEFDFNDMANGKVCGDEIVVTRFQCGLVPHSCLRWKTIDYACGKRYVDCEFSSWTDGELVCAP